MLTDARTLGNPNLPYAATLTQRIAVAVHNDMYERRSQGAASTADIKMVTAACFGTPDTCLI